jgi:DNA-binding PadR family transcriptional regulator
MRQPDGLRYALLGVVSRSPHGIHGYALRRQCERILGGFWQVNFGEVYRLLDRLCTEDLIEQVARGSGASLTTRKVYCITDKGRQSLDAFILETPADAPRPLRHELAVKLLFATPQQLPEVLALIHYQREVYAKQLQLVGYQRRKLQRLAGDTFVTGLLIDGAELTVRSELAWLEEVAAKLKARYGPPAR